MHSHRHSGAQATGLVDLLRLLDLKHQRPGWLCQVSFLPCYEAPATCLCMGLEAARSHSATARP